MSHMSKSETLVHSYKTRLNSYSTLTQLLLYSNVVFNHKLTLNVEASASQNLGHDSQSAALVKATYWKGPIQHGPEFRGRERPPSGEMSGGATIEVRYLTQQVTPPGQPQPLPGTTQLSIYKNNRQRCLAECDGGASGFPSLK